MAPRVAVVGATGAVGREMLAILEERDFPVSTLGLFASSRSAGASLNFRGQTHQVSELLDGSLSSFDIALFSAGGGTALRFAPGATAGGCTVIDNSSAFRMDPEVPLVVTEVNQSALAGHKGIIANPNCSTIQMVVALKPLYDFSRITRIVVSTYQAVSGTGHKAIQELRVLSEAFLSGEPLSPQVYQHSIAFNLIPQIDVFNESGYTKEEMKMVDETRKILGDEDIKITATTVRVPVFRSHSESVYIETEERIGAGKARKLLAGAPGVRVVDDPDAGAYPMPVDAAGTDYTYVGRIRDDLSVPNGLSLWIVADNLRKGAALNAVQIAEALLQEQEYGGSAAG